MAVGEELHIPTALPLYLLEEVGETQSLSWHSGERKNTGAGENMWN